MKPKTKSIFIAIFFIAACSLKRKTAEVTNYFEGYINYKTGFILKTDKPDTAYLFKAYGRTANLAFKEGNYLETYDAGFMLDQLYNKKDNKTYIRKNLSDTLYWYDCGTPGQKMLRFEINPRKEKILGIDCDELITYYDNRTVSYYFNPDTLKIDPEWYKRYVAFNKYENSRRMKSIYLKYKVEYPDLIVTVTATAITNKKIDDTVFSVPGNKILIEEK